MEVVVRLAAAVGDSAPLEAVVQTNLVGTYNVFEAARRAGVRRVVFASSGSTVSGWEREMPYQALVEGRYGDVYGASKVWGGCSSWPSRPRLGSASASSSRSRTTGGGIAISSTPAGF
jgi:NAD dependent epimerase/dehydratase family